MAEFTLNLTNLMRWKLVGLCTSETKRRKELMNQVSICREIDFDSDEESLYFKKRETVNGEQLIPNEPFLKDKATRPFNFDAKELTYLEDRIDNVEMNAWDIRNWADDFVKECQRARSLSQAARDSKKNDKNKE